MRVKETEAHLVDRNRGSGDNDKYETTAWLDDKTGAPRGR